MGFSLGASECLISPPYVFAAIVMYAFAYFGDKYHIRAPFIFANGIMSLIGLPLLGFAKSTGVRYFGVFLATAGTLRPFYRPPFRLCPLPASTKSAKAKLTHFSFLACNANVPCVLTYQANNNRGQWKRALCSATLVGAGGLGGIIGSTVFRDQDKPKYHPGIYTTMIASGMILIITAMMTFKFHRANKRADAGGKIIEGLEGFRYTL